jgi:ABC-2 type transport system ATP-binding protein
MSNAAIEVANLRKVFGAVTAIDGISFTVPRASVTALLGGNGAGKTTTLAILLGLMLPTSGRVQILGRDMLTDRFSVMARLNFSSPYVDLPQRMTVRQNLTVYGHLYGVPALRERITELGEKLQITDLFGRAYGQLSSGQRTRVSLAKSLLNKPDVLLLDEPTASLDPDTADWVRSYLLEYHRASGATILLASHNMSEVERMANHVLMMQTGKIVEQGSPQQLLQSYGRNNLEEVFLDIARNRRTAA